MASASRRTINLIRRFRRMSRRKSRRLRAALRTAASQPGSRPSEAPALELRGIRKSFGRLRAVDSVDLVVDWGRVHALLGENGAGKSTLMNVVYGMVTRDAGEISFDGRPAQIDGPQDAIKLGIGMVHQHFMRIPRLSVVENIMLGREVVRTSGVIDMDRAARTVSELSTRY